MIALNPNRLRTVVVITLAGLLGACSTVDAFRPAVAMARLDAAALPVPTPGAMPPCNDPGSVTSIPGKAWWAEQRWRYADDAAAIAAYQTLERTTPPWPNWFTPGDSILPAGTRFQMAMAPGQRDNQPGGFGTFDDIRTPEDVRDYLAVLYSWKPVVNRVVTFELVQPMKVQVGPIGPQIDPILCRLLPGRWSQFNMLVAPVDRMKYLKVIEVRMLN